MEDLIRAYIYLLKCKIDKKIVFINGLLVLGMMLVIICGMTMLCRMNYGVVSIFLDKYSLLLAFYVMITIVPLKIYSKFIVNKEFDRLFMTSISLKSCYAWIYSKQLMVMILILIGLYSLMIPTSISLKYNLLHHFFVTLSIILSIYNIEVLLELIIYRFVSDIYKIILAFVGIFEIVCFFILQALSVGEFDVYFTVNSFGINIIMILIGNAILIYVSYRLFVGGYYSKGFSSRKVIGSYKKRMEFIKTKEYKLFLRDFDRLKYVAVTLIIYISTAIIGANKVECSSLYIISVTFLAVIAFQLTVDVIAVDKNKKDLFILSSISWGTYIIDKAKFVISVTSVLCILFEAALFIYHKIMIKEMIVFLFGTQYLLLIPFIYCDIIGQLHLHEKEVPLKKKLIVYCKKILNMAVNLLLLCSTAVGVMSIHFNWYLKISVFILLSSIWGWRIRYRLNLMKKITFEQVVSA